MKPKDIGFVQEHIEKIILGVAVLFVLVVLWLYFLGRPYSVTLAGRESVPPAEVMDAVLQKARVLEQRLKDKQSPLPETPVPDYTQEFAERYKRRLLPVERFEVAMSGPGLGDFEGDVRERPIYVMPAIPAPAMARARAGFDVLAEFEDPGAAAPFIQLVGEQIPRDFPYASASATFSIDQVQQAFRSIPADQRVPEAWWRNRIIVTRVQLQRQQLDPVTGKWSEATDIAPLPHQVVYAVNGAEVQFDNAQELQERIRLEQDYIQRPPFPPTLNPWTPPDTEIAQLSPDDQRRLLKLDSDIATLRRQIQLLQRRTQSAPGTAPDRPRPVVRGPREVEGMMEDMTRPGPGPAAGPAGAGDQLAQLQEQLAAKMAERNQLLGIDGAVTDGFGMPMGPDGTGEFGMPPDMMPGRRGTQPPPGFPGFPGGPAMPGAPGEPGADASPTEVKVWAHDLTVEHGQTYRYRLVVHILNPLFQKKGLRPEQQQENVNKLSIASQPSEWTEPVMIEPNLRFFLVSAGSTVARIEIWRIFNGRWESHTTDVRPGELLGADVQLATGDVPATIPMKINGLVVDLREVGSGGPLSNTTYEMIYVDLDSGGMRTRVLAEDVNNPDLIRLRAEKARAAVAMQP